MRLGGIIMRFRTLAAIPTVAAVAIILAACSGTSGGSGAGSGGNANTPATTPVAKTWSPGGAYTGPIPPANGLPGPVSTWQLKPYTNADGYRMQDSVTFGVPLHFAIPNYLRDCYGGYQGGQLDLPPGEFVVPFEKHFANQTGQQAPAFGPDVWAGDSNGSPTVDVTGGNKDGNDTSATWANGDCSASDSHTLNAGGTDALYGFIGPATAAQLAAAYIYLTPVNDPQASQLSQPLLSVLPHTGAAWLAAKAGVALPAAPASPSAMPVSCPSAPAGYNSDQQLQFNGACMGWVGNVSDQLSQWDQHGASPLKAATDSCKYVVSLSPPSNDSRSQLVAACLAGVKAAGGP